MDDYGRGYHGGAPENHSQQYYAGVQAKRFHDQQRAQIAEQNAAHQAKRTYAPTTSEYSPSDIFGGIVTIGLVSLLIAVFGGGH